MSTHEEFELTKPQNKSSDRRAQFPATAAIVDQFEAVFGKVKVLAWTEGGEHRQIKNYSPDDPSREVTLTQYQQMGKASADNSKYVNEGTKRARREK